MEQKYQRLRKKVAFLFRLASQIEIEGIEHVPAQGGFLLATNHISRLDTPLLGVVTPRQVYGLVALKYKSFPPFRRLLDKAGAIWVRRTEFDRHALLESLAVLPPSLPIRHGTSSLVLRRMRKSKHNNSIASSTTMFFTLSIPPQI